MRRIAVVGCAGAGKSTFSLRLGERLGMPVTHLDSLFWRPGWNATPKDEWCETMVWLVAGERWLIDGNYGGTLDERLRAADTVIYLDAPRRVCMWRIVKRWATFRGSSRPDIGEGCPERLDWKFLKWIWDYPKVSRPKTLAALREKEGLTGREGGRVYVLRTNGDVEEFLRLAGPARSGVARVSVP
jgi:adenylate kinase family enzyme